jgi:hypothetical protein
MPEGGLHTPLVLLSDCKKAALGKHKTEDGLKAEIEKRKLAVRERERERVTTCLCVQVVCDEEEVFSVSACVRECLLLFALNLLFLRPLTHHKTTFLLFCQRGKKDLGAGPVGTK